MSAVEYPELFRDQNAAHLRAGLKLGAVKRIGGGIEAATGRRRGEGGLSEEKMLQDGDGVGEVDRGTVVGAGALQASWGGAALEEEVDQVDRVGDVDPAILVDLAGLKGCRSPASQRSRVPSPS